MVIACVLMAPDFPLLIPVCPVLRWNYKKWLLGLHLTNIEPGWEDLGWGHVNVQTVHTLRPLEVSSLLKTWNPDFLMAYGAAYTLAQDFVGKPYWATVFNYLTLDKQGEEITTCVWSGVHIFNYMPVRMLDRAEKANLEYVRLFACHNAWEHARKAQLLPSLYDFSKTLRLS